MNTELPQSIQPGAPEPSTAAAVNLELYLSDDPPDGWHIIDNMDADDLSEMLKLAINRARADRMELLEKWELYRSAMGQDVHDALSPKIAKLYMALNAKGRGDEQDLDGDPAKPWDQLIAALATATVYALANGRWASVEHRRAERLREALCELDNTAEMLLRQLGSGPTIVDPLYRGWQRPYRQAHDRAVELLSQPVTVAPSAPSGAGPGRG
jgi:hypothetical protein